MGEHGAAFLLALLAVAVLLGVAYAAAWLFGVVR